MLDFDFNITIVGLGLIGGSYAMALKNLRPKNIWAVDIDQEAIDTAQQLGIIDKGYIDPKIPLKNSDIIILCVYPNKMIQFIKENKNYFKKGAILTDTAGIKEKVIKEIEAVLPEDIDFIGGHPMAGREYKGIGFASEDIFKGASYILTPTQRNKAENIVCIEELIKKIGCKNIMKITPKKHDEIVSYTSQLPHIIATSLVNGAKKEDTINFIGGSFKDATRVAHMNTSLWTELLIENKNHILDKIIVFEKEIKKIKEALIEKNQNSLEGLFESAKQKREELI
nr:prephenate dehydrogenase [Anaerophilus nitritogenes]